jgi:TonB family protein
MSSASRVNPSSVPPPRDPVSMTIRLFLAALLLLSAAPALASQQPAAGDTSRVYMLTEVTTPPRPTNVAELRDALQAGYPAALQAAGREGIVEVAIVVRPDGTMGDVELVSSSGPGFDSATVAAVRVLRFTPASLDGRPVAVRVNLPVRWVPAVFVPSAADGRIYELAEVDEAPVPRNVEAIGERMAQLYPPWLREAGQGGTVTLRLHVDATGAVADARVTRSTNPQLDPPSLHVARELLFTPARVGGQPVAVWTEVPLEWQTEASAEPAAAAAPADTDGAPEYELSDVEEFPRVINAAAFHRELMLLYPEHLRGTGWSGEVQVRFRVDVQGEVSGPTIVQSSNPDFNEPSLRAVRHLRFHPARVNGRPVAVMVIQPIRWPAYTAPPPAPPGL